MSKASEWAAAGGSPHGRLTFRDRNIEAHTILTAGPRSAATAQRAMVSFSANGFYLVRLRETEAINLARWILDTFGESPTP